MVQKLNLFSLVMNSSQRQEALIHLQIQAIYTKWFQQQSKLKENDQLLIIIGPEPSFFNITNCYSIANLWYNSSLESIQDWIPGV